MILAHTDTSEHGLWLSGQRTANAIIMGVLNTTPDSFSDGGDYVDPQIALMRAGEMVSAGAQIIDVGGESTRPGAAQVDAQTELARTVDLIRQISDTMTATVSIDTYKAQVAARAVEAGAHIINDVSAARYDPDILNVAGDMGAEYVLTYHREDVLAAQNSVIEDARMFLEQKIEACLRAGIGEHNIILDPGIGFAKTVEQNYELIASLGHLKGLGFRVLVGASRKSFLQKISGVGAQDVLAGTLAAHMVAVAQGADIVRVHDVAEHAQFMQIAGKLIETERSD